MQFAKGHGTGNDFVLVPDPDGETPVDADLARALCDRRSGIGADGVLRVVRVDAAGLPPGAVAAAEGAGATWFMDHRNADGSTAEMCGNGIRVLGRWLVEAGLVPPGALPVLTRAGVRRLNVPADPAADVAVNMGIPVIAAEPVTVTLAEGPSYPGIAVTLGNPHAVAFVPGLAAAGALTVAPVVVPTAAFPTGANVELVVVTGPDSLALRVFERGVGETASCGTGACAAAVAAASAAGRTGAAAYDVSVPGGRLRVVWRAGTVRLSGPAVLVAQGVVRTGWAIAARGQGQRV